MNPRHRQRKSGQAIIFLIFVLVIGVFVVVWNFDLHRVISAKMRVQVMGDSAALAAARWQGHTLNMIGELNLIQAAIISDQISDFSTPIPEDVYALQELRARMDLIGPLASFVASQQAAFNNGAYHDDDLQKDIEFMASDIDWLIQEGYEGDYPDAYAEYADMLRAVSQTAAVGAYTLSLSGHPLEDESFYGAIAAAAGGWWCPMWQFQRVLGYYDGYQTWEGGVGNYRGDTDFYDLKSHAFTNVVDDGSGSFRYPRPPTMINTNVTSTGQYVDEIAEYLETNEVVMAHGDVNNLGAYYLVSNVSWSAYSANWGRDWPVAIGNGSVAAENGTFPIYADIQPKYDYMGAEAGVSISGQIEKGLVSRSDEETVDVDYKTKAKAFGYLEFEPLDPQLAQLYDKEVPPHYFGLILPAFREARLVHSDIGDPVLSGAFYRHVKYHLHPYLDDGPDGLAANCSYCDLLAVWETLDWSAGLEWLEYVHSLPNSQNPCYVPGGPNGGGGGGGASGGT